jgi:hypothetical protein
MKYADNTTSRENPAGPSMEIKARNLKELSAIYNISSRTLKKWLHPFEEEIGQRVGYFYTITQVKKIFALLGLPGVLNEED